MFGLGQTPTVQVTYGSGAAPTGARPTTVGPGASGGTLLQYYGGTDPTRLMSFAADQVLRSQQTAEQSADLVPQTQPRSLGPILALVAGGIAFTAGYIILRRRRG